MTKTVAEEIRAWATKLEEMANRNRSYDMEIEVENWDESDDENVPGYLNLGIDYSIVGKHRPATWGYHGGEPAEEPELDEYRVYNADTGQEITDIPQSVQNDIEKAIWDHAESRKDDDFDPPDNYDDYDSRY
jgi:hypothetical protein